MGAEMVTEILAFIDGLTDAGDYTNRLPKENTE